MLPPLVFAPGIVVHMVMINSHILSPYEFGTPSRIRTDSYDTPFERAAFTDLAIGVYILAPLERFELP